MLRTIKPKTARAKRALKHREPKVVENIKTAMFMKGTKSSQLVTEAMADLSALKKPNCITLSKKNDFHPFDDTSSLEFLAQKNDASLFVFGSHSKKRPNHLCIGRTFDGRVLDMIELKMDAFVPAEYFTNYSCGVGQKPLFVFSGEQFEHDEEYKTLRSIFLDFYRGQTMEKISLTGLEHVICITADPKNPRQFTMRTYAVLLKKSGSRVPRVELADMGPHFDFTLDRVRLPDNDMLKQAMRTPKTTQPKKVKNITKDELGDKFGRVHLGVQDLAKLQTRKMKGLKKRGAPGDDGPESKKVRDD